MKRRHLFWFLIFPTIVFAQEIKVLKPELGKDLDFSAKVQQEWRVRDQVLNALSTGKKQWDESTVSEKNLMAKYGEVYESMWDIIGSGCSWYCGGGQDSLSASSELASTTKITYSASNAHDLSYKTAWVEGVDGYGIGEYLTYHVQPTNPRITEVIVVNGYVKSEQAWRDNARVKKLKMYIDDEPHVILNLLDTKTEQHFKVEPIGESDRKNMTALAKKPLWTMKFEILEVYEGDKYEDTAITEIYFDGIDVH